MPDVCYVFCILLTERKGNRRDLAMVHIWCFQISTANGRLKIYSKTVTNANSWVSVWADILSPVQSVGMVPVVINLNLSLDVLIEIGALSLIESNITFTSQNGMLKH